MTAPRISQFLLATALLLWSSPAHAQTPSGWTWVRDFEVIDSIGNRAPAQGTAVLFRGVADQNGDVLMLAQNMIVSPLVEGRASFALPQQDDTMLALLFVASDPTATLRFAPYLSHFSIGPIDVTTADAGIILESGEPVTVLSALETADNPFPAVLVESGLSLYHPSLIGGLAVPSCTVDAVTADLFAMPKWTGRQSGIGAGTVGTGSSGTGPGLTAGRQTIGGVFFELPWAVDQVSIGIPDLLGPDLDSASPSEYMLIDMDSGTRLAAGAAADSIEIDFGGQLASNLLIVLYERTTLGWQIQPLGSGDCTCPAKEDKSPGGQCDVSQSDCTVRFFRLNDMGVDMCYTAAGGGYGPPIPGASQSVTVSQSNTTTTTTSSSSQTSINLTLEKGVDVGVASWSAKISGGQAWLQSQGKSVSAMSGTSSMISIGPGWTLALRWTEIECTYECVVGTSNFAPYGGVVQLLQSSVEAVSCPGSVSVSLERCDKFNPQSKAASDDC